MQLIYQYAADINMTGTSSGAEGSVVVDLVCWEECEDITATGTYLSAPDGDATYVCQNIATVDEVSQHRLCVRYAL